MRAALWLSTPVLQTVAVVAVSLLLDIRVCAQDCRYRYVEQPLPNPLCDPYDAGILTLECSVVAPSSATSVYIGWILDCDQLHNNSDITITSQVQRHATMAKVQRVRSRLTIMNFSDRYAGEYTCTLLGGDFIPSDPFRLPTEYDLMTTTGLTACGPDFIHSRDQERCAELSEDRTIPMPLTCRDTSPSDIRASLPQQTAAPSPTSTPFNHPLSISAPLFTPALPLPDETKETGPRADAIWPYVMAAVAASLLPILIVVAVLYMKKCIKKSHRITHNEQQHENGTIEVGRNPLYGAFSGGPTPSNDMHITIIEGGGAHTTGHSTADDPMYMNISEVHNAQSAEEIQHHNSPMLTTSHVYDYIPLDSAGNINRHNAQSVEEIQHHNSPMLTTSHVYDYIPLDSAGNINRPPATSNISGTDTSAGGVTNTPSIAEV